MLEGREQRTAPLAALSRLRKHGATIEILPIRHQRDADCPKCLSARR
jgi:hypothetical protein